MFCGLRLLPLSNIARKGRLVSRLANLFHRPREHRSIQSAGYEEPMRYRTISAMTVFIGFVVFAQKPPTLSLHISEVMTRTETRLTGVSRLTTAERTALDDWLNRYTVRVLDVGHGGSSSRSGMDN